MNISCRIFFQLRETLKYYVLQKLSLQKQTYMLGLIVRHVANKASKRQMGGKNFAPFLPIQQFISRISSFINQVYLQLHAGNLASIVLSSLIKNK